MKTILFLGGSRHQIPPIRYAKENGYRTICCDYTPNAPGFDLADAWYPISTTDMDAVLEVAIKEKIDGVVAYASDPAAPTAAYVAEKLGLPGNPYSSVDILTNKEKFRTFLRVNDFNCPKTLDTFQFPMVVKPVDSSGSKGVAVVNNSIEAYEAMEVAQQFSRSGKIILEEYIQREGYQIAGDGFLVDGELVFRCFANDHFDSMRGIVLTGQSFPCVHSEEVQNRVHAELQRALDILGMRTGALNFEAIIHDGEIYIMEIGPRNGGTFIPETTRYVSGIDMIAATVEAALGHQVSFPAQQDNGFYSSCVIHSLRDGRFDELDIDESIHIVDAYLIPDSGDSVGVYTGTHRIMGMMILKFSSQEEMLHKMDNIHKYIRVSVR